MGKNIFKKPVIIALIVVFLFALGFVTFKFVFQGNLLTSLIPQYAGKSDNSRFVVEESAPSGAEFTQSDTGEMKYEASSSTTNFGLKIIKQGSVNMLVDEGKFFESWNKLSSLVSVYSGSIISSNYYKQQDYYFGGITIVIPSKDFDKFINDLSNIGKVESLTVNSQDVTSEYVDLNSRLKVLESSRDLLLGWLKSAKTVDEMIKLRNEIQRVEEEIETIKGRLNYISFHTDFSQISINLSEKEGIITSHNKFVDYLVYWLKKPLYALLYSVIGLLVLFAFVIPWGIIGFVIYKVVVKVRK